VLAFFARYLSFSRTKKARQMAGYFDAGDQSRKIVANPRKMKKITDCP